MVGYFEFLCFNDPLYILILIEVSFIVLFDQWYF
jgi:hypothetical protein